MNNAILIYEENSEIKQRFCPEQEARDFLVEAQREMRGGTMFAFEFEATLALEIVRGIRDRVATAKAKLKSDTRLRDLLTKHGVPMDRDLRIAIYRAFEDWKSGI